MTKDEEKQLKEVIAAARKRGEQQRRIREAAIAAKWIYRRLQ